MTSSLAVFDLDGTITRHDTLGPYLWGYLRRHPWRVLRMILAVPAPFLYLINRDRGALKGTAIRVVLGGVSREQIEQWSTKFVREVLQTGLFPEALDAIARHRAQGDRLLLMSASTDLYVPQLGQALGFDQVICTRVRWHADGRLDGRLAGANCRGEEKRRCLAEILAQSSFTRIAAYGNAASDLAHMALAHESFLVNAPAHLTQDPKGTVRGVRWGAHSH